MEYDLLLLNITRDSKSVSPYYRESIGQHIIASYLSNHYFKAKTLSCFASSCKDIIIEEIRNKNLKNIGLYCSSDNYNIVSNVIRYLKQNFELNIILGGPEAVGLGEDFLKSTSCDVIVSGEGEEAVLELLNYYIDGYGNLKDIRNIKYIDCDGIYRENEIRYPIRNLDDIPFLNINNSINQSYKKSDVAGILTGRGCPFSCKFCYEGAHSDNVRYRSLDKVFEEIDYIKSVNPNLNFINIYDDTFTLNEERVYEFCDRIKKRNLKWFCEGHIRTTYNKKDMIKKMVESGLISMQIGIESGSNTVLEAYNKYTTSEMIIELTKICKECKLQTLSGNFIIGGAMENENTIKESMKLAKSMIKYGIGMVELRTVYLAMYPMTAISKNPEKFEINLIKEQVNKSVYTMQNAVVETKNLTRQEIIKSKERFDKELVSTYKKYAQKATKSEILSCFNPKNKTESLNIYWSKTFLSMSYIYNFLHNIGDDREFLSSKNKKDILDMYFIRTFDLLKYDNRNRLIIEGLKFDNLEKIILENAVGRHTLRELSYIYDLHQDCIYDVCKSLNNRCLLYFSDF